MFKYRIKYIKILFLCFFCIFCFYDKKALKIKVAICTMAKNENLYIKEFVDYYIKIGIDHFFIYDSNEPNTEKISDVIGKSYKQYITIYDNKTKIKNQKIAYTTCYNENKNKYDWFFMIDIDEYLYIKNNTLKNYLSNKIFDKCDFIKIHWVQPTDNNKLYYENKPLLERFKRPYLKDTHIKTFVRGNIEGLKYVIHSPSESPKRNITCNNAGKRLNYPKIHFQDVFEINYEKAYIIHFKYKSTQEYINKIKRGYEWESKKFLKMRIREYFKDNEITMKKIKYMEKELKIDLSKYKKLLKNPKYKILKNSKKKSKIKKFNF